MTDLRKLRHATTLADSGTFALASQRLHLSQSALSRSIQALEKELQLTLFERGKGGLRLTPEGKVVLARARTLLKQADNLEREVISLKNRNSGRIAFGIGPAMPSIFLPELLVRLSQQRPTLSVEVTVGSAPELLELLREELIDFFVADVRGLPRLDSDPFQSEILLNLQPGFFVRRDHPLARRSRAQPPVQQSDLRDYPLISPQYRKQSGGRQVEERQVLSRVVCNDLESLREMVLRTDAVLVGLPTMVKREIDTGSICPLPILDARYSEPGQINLVSSATQLPSPDTLLVRQLIGQLMGPA